MNLLDYPQWVKKKFLDIFVEVKKWVDRSDGGVSKSSNKPKSFVSEFHIY